MATRFAPDGCIVAGAGSLAAACALNDKSIKAIVLECAPEVCGNTRSFAVDSFVFDYARHLLHLDRCGTPAAGATLEQYLLAGFGVFLAGEVLVPLNEKTLATPTSRLTTAAVNRFFPAPDPVHNEGAVLDGQVTRFLAALTPDLRCRLMAVCERLAAVFSGFVRVVEVPVTIRETRATPIRVRRVPKVSRALRDLRASVRRVPVRSAPC
jgi:hypothetical protein